MTARAVALALPLIRRFEGCRLCSYRDAAGYWTVGYGSRFLAGGRLVTQGITLTQSGADALLAAQVEKIAAQVDAVAPESATDAQRAALVSFAYNLGTGALKESTLLRKFRDGDVGGAAAQFGAWVYADGKKLPGLVERRAAEARLFLGSEPEESADSLNEKELQQLQG